eukprot:CAMPEP_0202507474 /NCGR_PEP_ID=MMETSP1361-20130828/51745_1 /ASSEMBLY_ACC=CAM_ASM_000849 /TAXON_ID=210615 /ORGANISM="Staurosira complex sp., Strain CCMP2646" /LENGTH=467 /DNA_ID=CAMNT_0049141601 /DNA_START=40 /DNA_END=1443 /DNA_ORIENTATION=-
MAQQQQVAYYHHSTLYPPPTTNDSVLLARLQAQVEFYFSPQNLAKDVFLSSLLEQHENAVPLETIASFPKVRQLHAVGRLGMIGVPTSQMPPADPTFLAKALEESRVVKVSGQWIHLVTTQGTATTTRNDVSPSPALEETTANNAGATATSTPSSPSTTASSAGVPTHPIPNKEQGPSMSQQQQQQQQREGRSFVPHYYPPPQHHYSGVTSQGHVVYDPYYTAAVLHHQQQQQQQQHSGVTSQGHVVYDPYYTAAVLHHQQQQQQQQQQQDLYGAYHPAAMYGQPSPYGHQPVYHYSYAPQHHVQHGMPVLPYPHHYPMPPPPTFPQPFSEVRRNKNRGNVNPNRKSKPSTRRDSNYNRNENSNHQQQRKNTRKQTKTNDEFPALVEKEHKSFKEPNIEGYAAALKKQPPARRECNTTSADDDKHPPMSHGESTAQLEQDLSQLKVSNTMETEQEIWDEEEEASDVW